MKLSLLFRFSVVGVVEMGGWNNIARKDLLMRFIRFLLCCWCLVPCCLTHIFSLSFSLFLFHLRFVSVSFYSTVDFTTVLPQRKLRFSVQAFFFFWEGLEVVWYVFIRQYDELSQPGCTFFSLSVRIRYANCFFFLVSIGRDREREFSSSSRI